MAWLIPVILGIGGTLGGVLIGQKAQPNVTNISYGPGSTVFQRDQSNATNTASDPFGLGGIIQGVGPLVVLIMLMSFLPMITQRGGQKGS